MTEPKSIGIIGAGRVGTAIARRALDAGYQVSLATARPPAELELMLDFVAAGARAGTIETVVAESDILVLALPLSRYRSLRPDLFAGRIVIDAMNYWAPTDGAMTEFERGLSSTEVLAGHLEGARLVRTFNHMGYHEIDGEARRAGDPERRALAVAGDDASAKQAVAAFVDRIGFDPVDAGGLSTAGRFDVGSPIFGAPLGAQAMRAALAPPLAA